MILAGTWWWDADLRPFPATSLKSKGSSVTVTWTTSSPRKRCSHSLCAGARVSSIFQDIEHARTESGDFDRRDVTSVAARCERAAPRCLPKHGRESLVAARVWTLRGVLAVAMERTS